MSPKPSSNLSVGLTTFCQAHLDESFVPDVWSPFPGRKASFWTLVPGGNGEASARWCSSIEVGQHMFFWEGDAEKRETLQPPQIVLFPRVLSEVFKTEAICM